MAVEIKEIVIKAIVSSSPKFGTTGAKEVIEENNSALVQECVTQVLRILKSKNNR